MMVVLFEEDVLRMIWAYALQSGEFQKKTVYLWWAEKRVGYDIVQVI